MSSEATGIPVPAQVFPEPGLFCLEIIDDALGGDGIEPGDYLIIDPGRAAATDGDLAVVEFTSAETGERVSQAGHVHPNTVTIGEQPGGMVLTASNRAYPPSIITAAARPQITGVVVGTARRRGRRPWRFDRFTGTGGR